MGYRLGVDLGTTFTAAAVERDGRAEVVPLGDHAPQIPSVVFVREDGHLLVGEAAARRGAVQPDRVAREFKRQLGDPVPRLLGGEEFPVERLTARLLRWVVDTVVEREGGPPDRLALTHPANWGPHRLATLQDAVRESGVGPVTMVTEPAAAAVHFASTERADDGDVLLVYDLGGGTFDTRCCAEPQRSSRYWGGRRASPGSAASTSTTACSATSWPASAAPVPTSIPTTRRSSRPWRDCAGSARRGEALSTDSETLVMSRCPGSRQRCGSPGPSSRTWCGRRRPDAGLLQRALTSAGVTRDGIRTVVLVGGSARIPLVREVLGRN